MRGFQQWWEEIVFPWALGGKETHEEEDSGMNYSDSPEMERNGWI